MRVIYPQRFADDLDAIADFIRPDSPERAVTFVEEIAEVCANVIERNPLVGHRKPEFGQHTYSFVIHHRVILYTFEPVFGRLTFRRVIKRQNISRRDFAD